MDDQVRDTVVIVPDVDEYAGMLLDEWDTHITAWAEAMEDAAQARRELAMTRESMAIIEAEIVIAVDGPTEGERRARALLALYQHDGWRRHREAIRATRDRILRAEHRAALAQMRTELVRAALVAREHEGGDS